MNRRRSQSQRDAVQGITPAAFARGRKVTRQAVRVAIQTGRIRYIRGTKLLDPKAAGRAWDEHADVAKRRGPGADARRRRRAGESEEGPTLYESKARREAALAELAEVDLARARGEMVFRSDVAKEAGDCARKTKDAVLAAPANIIDSLEALGIADVVSAQRILTEALTRALAGVAGEISGEPEIPPRAHEAKAS